MKIIKNTLQEHYETWTDPGDYPSGAGSSPLPPRQFVSRVSGELIAKPEIEDLLDYLKSDYWDTTLGDFLTSKLGDTELTCKVISWNIEVNEDKTLTFRVLDEE